MKTIEQLIFFHQKMCHLISLKVIKLQQPLLITLGVADEKPERAPRETGLTPSISSNCLVNSSRYGTSQENFEQGHSVLHAEVFKMRDEKKL